MRTTEQVTFSVTIDELTAITLVARRTGVSVDSLVRDIVCEDFDISEEVRKLCDSSSR